MARIRTIKPEFWSSEQVVECSPTARLLFIGLWNFCDDAGIHPASAKTLKMRIFPGDTIPTEEIDGLMQELISQELLARYTVDGVAYLMVTGWDKHQKIEKPSFKHPKPQKSATAPQSFDDRSANDQRKLGDRHPPERNGRESNGGGGGMEPANARQTPPPTTPAPAIPDDPVAFAREVAKAYCAGTGNPEPLVPLLTAMEIVNRRNFYARCADLDWWQNYFAAVAEDDLLMGRKPRNGEPGRVASFGYLVSEKCIADMVARSQQEAVHG